MDDSFSQALADWSAFYALMGGAAATLLGLLFVAVSLRLNIFHQRDVADVRDFAAVNLGTFLGAIAVAGVALAPHGHPRTMVAALLAIGVAGLSAVAWTARVSMRLNQPMSGSRPDPASSPWRGVHYGLLMVCPYVVLFVAAVQLWRAHPDALGWLAVVEGWLLGSGTVAAWILLSHAGRVSDDGTGNP